MKQFSLFFAALMLVVSAPALAQDHSDQHQNQNQNQHGHAPQHHQAPPPRNNNVHRYHEGQNYNGHHLTNRGGHWGYYQPRNGAQVFINIPL
jgi:hypothetical protein